jgi:hypothetical protein
VTLAALLGGIAIGGIVGVFARDYAWGKKQKLWQEQLNCTTFDLNVYREKTAASEIQVRDMRKRLAVIQDLPSLAVLHRGRGVGAK